MPVLRDFQISVDVARFAPAVFSFFEPIRLWLKDQRHRAPFQKLVVSLDDHPRSRLSDDGAVSVVLGICRVYRVLPADSLASRVERPRDLATLTLESLEFIERSIGWSMPELAMEVERLGRCTPPLEYVFPKFRRARKQGESYDVVFRASELGSSVIVRVTSPEGVVRDHEVAGSTAPLYMEDDFPLARVALRSDCFELLDKRGNVLARVVTNPTKSPHLH